MMKDSVKFLRELRAEIEAAQARRALFIRQKLVFVVSMIGIGSISIMQANTTILLYLAPFVAYIFDLYVYSDDYKIQRAGAFIKNSRKAPKEEVRWETAICTYREPFSKVASFCSSLLVLIIAATLLFQKKSIEIYVWWLIINLLILIIGWLYRVYINKKLKWFCEEIDKQKEET